MSSNTVTLYKYVSINYLIDIIDKGRLYLSDGTNFNDPFEITITDKKKHKTKHISGLHILSLTNSFRNKLIWSHYTDSHKGVCLTLKVPKEYVYPICYTSKRVYDDSDIDEIISTNKSISKKNIDNDFSLLSKDKKIAYIKDKKWNYEKEYRIVFDQNDEDKIIREGDKCYFPVKITNIYFGVNFDRNDKDKKEKIIEICKRKKIKMTYMELSKTNYALNVKESKSLSK